MTFVGWERVQYTKVTQRRAVLHAACLVIWILICIFTLTNISQIPRLQLTLEGYAGRSVDMHIITDEGEDDSLNGSSELNE